MKKDAFYIDLAQAKPGDVFLSYGTSLFAKLVALLDGGSYSHASLFMGSKVIECARDKGGVEASDLYRFQLKNDSESELQDGLLKPVLDRAAYYLNQHDDYDSDPELLLLGVVLV